MSVPKDTCLQCGQTRAQVRQEGTSCGTTEGYEVVEMLDEWARHHWRDWSDAELKAQGIHPSLWEENRRTDFYDLWLPHRRSHCMQNGHKYPRPWHPPMHRDRLDMFPPDTCLTCYEKRGEEMPSE